MAVGAGCSALVVFNFPLVKLPVDRIILDDVSLLLADRLGVIGAPGHRLQSGTTKLLPENGRSVGFVVVREKGAIRLAMFQPISSLFSG